MDCAALTVEEFVQAAWEFVKISEQIRDNWRFYENYTVSYKSYLKKDTFISLGQDENSLVKAEYVIFYNQSYGVPSFSFNIWNCNGMLLTLEDIRKMSFVKINKEAFYSVITQQEHPIFGRPYFIMHPCQTETLLVSFKAQTKNIIVTFLGLITPLIKLNLPLEYGL